MSFFKDLNKKIEAGAEWLTPYLPWIQVIGLIGLVIAAVAIYFQYTTFIEDQKKPELKCNYKIELSQENKLLETADDLTEEFYRRLYQKVQASPHLSYRDAVEEILPVETSVPPQSLSAKILVKNEGVLNATNVEIFVDIGRPIASDPEIESIDAHAIIKGGKGENSVLIRIDRVRTEEAVAVTVTSQEMDTGQLDRLAILSPTALESQAESFRVDPGQMVVIELEGDRFVYQVEEFGDIKFFPSILGPPRLFFPQIRHVPAQKASFEIKVDDEKRSTPCTLQSIPNL